MAKESLLDRLRSKPTEAPDEEGKLRKELTYGTSHTALFRAA